MLSTKLVETLGTFGFALCALALIVAALFEEFGGDQATDEEMINVSEPRTSQLSWLQLEHYALYSSSHLCSKTRNKFAYKHLGACARLLGQVAALHGGCSISDAHCLSASLS